MAAYGVIITDNNDNTFTLTVCNRGTTSTTVTGGTNLLTNTFTQVAGVTTVATGFLNSAQTSTMRSPMEAMERALEIITNDRSFNG